ncbi:hypothetical protein QJS10_CPB14g00847 [Acorus calamus]|uniref:C2H2-type domain-containing protein n=1 Tax=Acorus calamus TaxID=4465 RepID=A0AAV9DDS8_ACOCL|nr:hypothetical protein QJS10_CPB14g00847 [Acorus calamus]
MATTVRSLLNTLLLLLLHLGCFFCSSHQSHTKKRKISPISSPSHSPPPSKSHKTLSLSNLKRLLSLTKPPTINEEQHLQQQQQSIVPIPPKPIFQSDPLIKNLSFPSRLDIFPCNLCGEVFIKPHLLDHHVSTRHALSELSDSDSGMNIVRIIFQSGWRGRDMTPAVHRIFKIHNNPKTLARFEEYRDSIRSKAARAAAGGGGGRRNERCAADGNERLRFHCSTLICSLGEAAAGGVCGGQFCSTCGIVRGGFSPKMDGIATHSTSWGAHASLPADLEEEFGFLHVRRAMLVCRVVAGRVAPDPMMDDGSSDKEGGGGYDSVVGRSRAGLKEDEELFVFSPRAVLPCFVITYGVS